MNKRILIDLLIALLMPFLMSYSLIGEEFHELLGITIFLLFILHHWINRRWWLSLRKGKYTTFRIVNTTIDFLLLIFLILQPLSGILISKHLFTFISLPFSVATAREIHLVLAFWGFLFMFLHVGIHLTAVFEKLKKQNRILLILTTVLLIAISVYGIFSFIKRGFLDYMFLQQQFFFIDLNEPIILFFTDYLSIMTLISTIGYCLDTLLRRFK